MATIAPLGKYRAFDDNGEPLAGGKLYTYEAGTTTPKATYTTEMGDVANTNPVILDSAGYADVWLGDGGYKFVLADADDVIIFTVDNIGGIGTSAFGGQVNDITVNTSITNLYANSVNICNGTITLSLLSVESAGEGFYFSVKNDGSDLVTIDPDAGETIDGQSTKIIPPGSSCLVITDGDEWFTLFFDVSSSGDNTFTGNNSFTGKIRTPSDGELTINSGEITVTGAYHTIDTEGDAATDDLETINGGADGQILVIRAADDLRNIVIKSTGNIANGAGGDIPLSNSNDLMVLKYDAGKSKWLAQGATSAQGGKIDSLMLSSPKTILSGLSCSNSVSDATNDIVVQAGAVISDDGTTIISLVSGLTKRLDATFVAGNNQGGRDTGSIANDAWYVFAICKDAGEDSDILFSLSKTAPTLPATYTKKALIGSFIRVSNTIVQFTQFEDTVILVNPYQVFSGNATTGTPATYDVLIGGAVGYFSYTVGSGSTAINYGLVYDADKTGGTPSATNFNIAIQSNTNGSNQFTNGSLISGINDAGNIKHQGTNTYPVNLVLTGWKLRR